MNPLFAKVIGCTSQITSHILNGCATKKRN
jgi:hypothetical protein